MSDEDRAKADGEKHPLAVSDARYSLDRTGSVT